MNANEYTHTHTHMHTSQTFHAHKRTHPHKHNISSAVTWTCRDSQSQAMVNTHSDTLYILTRRHSGTHTHIQHIVCSEMDLSLRADASSV